MVIIDKNKRPYAKEIDYHVASNYDKSDDSDEDGDFSQFQTSKEKPPEVEATSREPLSRDYLCGIGSWRPAALQKFANHRMFALSYVIIGVVQGMIYSYFNGVLTTVEKTFAIPSKTLGIILSGNDISQILCGVILTYIGGRGSRPRWLAIGMILTSFSCFLYASAQIFWDGETIHKITANAHHTKESMASSMHTMCQPDEETYWLNSTVKPIEDQCGGHSSASISALVAFFVGQFISGIGSTALFTLGFTYMDDSVKKSVSPIYISISGALRSLGPTIGYLLASACLKIYIRPSETPEYNQTDPRWLGAWWMGFLIIGSLQLLITFPILLFPKELPSNAKSINSEKTEEKVQPKEIKPSIWKEFGQSMRRLFKNPLVVFHLMAVGPIVLGMVGFSMFLPKYLEAQFGQTAAQASVLTGISGLFMMMVGTMGGGIILWKFQPSAKKVLIWAICVDIVYSLGIFTIMQFECDKATFTGIDLSDGLINITSSCSRNCDCETVFDPVCASGANYLSPCLAGCISFNGTNDDKTKNFMNCTCAFMPTNVTDEWANGISGYCPGSRGNCYYFWPYLLILGTIKMLASTNRVGGMIIILRGVNKEDKSLLMALLSAVTSLFGFIPGPIIYGAVVDSTCLLWDEKGCGKKGNCWLYNLDDLRYWFHGITMSCFAIAIILDLLIMRVVPEMNLYGDDPPSRVLSFSEAFLCKKKPELQYKSSTDKKSPA
ncbi:hypothetical protein CHUAL_002367 [Chamberlinius hualienensis]